MEQQEIDYLKGICDLAKKTPWWPPGEKLGAEVIELSDPDPKTTDVQAFAYAVFCAQAAAYLPKLVAEVEKLQGLLEEVLPQLDFYAEGLSYFPQRSESVKMLASRIREALGEEK